jgi:hypothetical protein
MTDQHDRDRGKRRALARLEHIDHSRPRILMRRILWPLLALTLTLPVSVRGQQSPEDWDPARLHVTRTELQDLLARYEAVANSSAYSGGYRDQAREEATRIRERLEQGDFRVGDRIWLQVEGETELPDTLVVEPGPSITLPDIGNIPLKGVLRAELQEHLTKELARYIQEPKVRTQSMVRLQLQGQIGTPGFYVLPSDMLLSDALMEAGAPSREADMDKIKLERGPETLMEGEQVAKALQDGRSLDQLGLRAGDLIEVPEKPNRRIWSQVFRYGAIITSSLLLGIRIF